MLPQFMPPLSSSRPRAHLLLPTPPLWSPFPKARHRDTVASVVVPEPLIPRTNFLFLFLRRRLRRRCQLCGPGSEIILTFELMTSYFFWRWFAPVTIRRGCQTNLVGDSTIENSWGANWIPILFYEEYKILWLSFMCVVSDINETGKRPLKSDSQ